MSAGQANSVLARKLDRLVQPTAAHFAHEESLLRWHRYPDFAYIPWLKEKKVA
jgi:hemerythrin